MSIRLRKTAIAAAIEDVAAAREQQSGSYEGPRVLSDEPARAVVDLATYRPPVLPDYRNLEVVLTPGDRLLYDPATGESGTNVLQRRRTELGFSFIRWMQIRTFNGGGSSGTYDVFMRVVSDFDPPAAPGINTRLLMENSVGAGAVRIVQYGYEAPDLRGPNRVVVPPDGLVAGPETRHIIDVDNGTDKDLEVFVDSQTYLFSGTDLLI